MHNSTFERAATAARRAVADWSPANEGSQYAYIARAVLNAVRLPGADIMQKAFCDVLEPVYPGDFDRVIQAILEEDQ